MGMNLVTVGMSFLGPVLARKIADVLGIDSPVVVKAISAAIPAILAAVVGKGAKKEGAGSMLGLLSSAEGGSPEEFESRLDDAALGEYAADGGTLLRDLIGSEETTGIANAVGRHAELPGDSAQTLLGAIAPAIAGMLKGQVAENDLDANGFAEMLKAQAPNIAKAMPEGFARELAGTGIVDALGKQIPASEASRQIAAAEAEAANGASGITKWIILALIAVVVAWFALGKGTPDMGGIADGAIVVGDTNISEQFGAITEDLTDTLGSVTDAVSAEAALPQLEEVTRQVDGLGGLVGQLGG